MKAVGTLNEFLVAMLAGAVVAIALFYIGLASKGEIGGVA